MDDGKRPHTPMALVVERQVDRLIEVERCLRDPARKTHVTNLADEVPLPARNDGSGSLRD